MGISRRTRQADKENEAKFNRESRPWDNQASLSKLPKLATTRHIRPPPPRPPTDERFVPLLRNTIPENGQDSQEIQAGSRGCPTAMSVSPRRKADHLSSSNNFSPVDTRAFKTASVRYGPSEAAVKRERAAQADRDKGQADSRGRSPNVMSVSDRLRMFESPDESMRARPPSHVLRNSPFRGALEAFGGVTPEEPPQSMSAKSASSSEAETTVSPPPAQEAIKKLGNREVTPIHSFPRPPPLIGLPIPTAEDCYPALQSDPVPHQRKSRGSVRQPVIPGLDMASGTNSHDWNEEKSEKSQRPREIWKEDPAGDNFEDLACSSSGNLSEPTSSNASEAFSREQPTNDLSEPRAPSSKMGLEDPSLMPRFSYRHSMRLPSMSMPDTPYANEPVVRSSFRHSRRIDVGQGVTLGSFPESSSFLDFDADERLSSLREGNPEAKPKRRSTGVWANMTFDEPDSFDTFGSLPQEVEAHEKAELASEHAKEATLPRPGSDESEKPLTPMISFSNKAPAAKDKRKGQSEDDEDGALDVPNRFTRRPGAAGALRDLQRASVTAGNEIAASLRLMGAEVGHAATKDKAVSRVQGDVLLRSRIFRRWNVRYASIVHQGYFGAVLLLFRSDSKGAASSGPMGLRSSKMIALAESSVSRIEGKKSSTMFMFELKTSQRTYRFGCNDEEGREFWVRNLSQSRS